MSTTPHDPAVTTAETSRRDAAIDRVRRANSRTEQLAQLSRATSDAVAAGVSVTELAAALDVNRSTVHRWLQGKR